MQSQGKYQPDLIQSLPSDEGVNFWTTLRTMREYEACVAMPGCAGIAYTLTEGFSMVPLLISDSVSNGWNERDVADFMNDTLVYNPENGDMAGVFITGAALYRNIGEKEQRIVVLGDSDWASNVEMMNGREGIHSYNNMLIYGIFRWMSYDALPVDVGMPRKIDNYLALNENNIDIWKIVFMGLLPVGLLIFVIVLQVRRRAR